MENSSETSTKSQAKQPFFTILKVVADVFQPNLDPECYSVYSVLVRRANFYAHPTNSARELAAAANISPNTAWRSLQILVHIELIKRIRHGGSQPDSYELLDAFGAAQQWGITYNSRSVSYSLSAEGRHRLREAVAAVKLKLQGPKRRRVDDIVEAGAVLETRFGVSLEKHQLVSGERQRVIRETQTRTHLLEERRTEEAPTPTPTPNGVGEAQEDKNSPDEDAPDSLVKWAKANFIGVMNDLGDYLFDTNRPPNPYFANGAADWEEFGFDSLAVEGAARRGETLVLTLSASNPETARRGLEKYHRTLGASLRRWYRCEVELVLLKSRRRSP